MTHTPAPDAARQTPDDGDNEGAWQPHPDRWRILTVSLVIGFMSLLDVTIVNVALPSIREGLGATPSGVQWVVSGYSLAFGLTLVAGGRLGDAFGRRRMMMYGLIGFVTASAAVGFAPGETTAIIARLAQGAAAGMLTPQNTGLIQELFRGPERGRAFGLFGLTVSISSATGPVLGGLIIAALGPDLGWRAIFLVNVPIGAVALVFVARLVPARPPRAGGAHSKPDIVGTLLLGLGVLAVLYPLIDLIGGVSVTLGLVALAPVLLFLFTRWERRLVSRHQVPLLDVRLLGQAPGYASGIALGTLYFTGFTGVFLVLSVFLQDGLGYSPLNTGFLLTPFALGSALTASLAGRWVSRIGRRVTVIALLGVLTGLISTAVAVPFVEDGGLVWVLAPMLLLAGLGGGGVISPNFTLTLAEVPPRMGGAAGGALQTGSRIGSALGSALAISVYQVTLGRYDDPGIALRAALGAAVLVILAALAVAVRDLRLDADRDLVRG